MRQFNIAREVNYPSTKFRGWLLYRRKKQKAIFL